MDLSKVLISCFVILSLPAFSADVKCVESLTPLGGSRGFEFAITEQRDLWEKILEFRLRPFASAAGSVRVIVDDSSDGLVINVAENLPPEAMDLIRADVKNRAKMSTELQVIALENSLGLPPEARAKFTRKAANALLTADTTPLAIELLVKDSLEKRADPAAVLSRLAEIGFAVESQEPIGNGDGLHLAVSVRGKGSANAVKEAATIVEVNTVRLDTKSTK